jgi:hypothetical protein
MFKQIGREFSHQQRKRKEIFRKHEFIVTMATSSGQILEYKFRCPEQARAKYKFLKQTYPNNCVKKDFI